MGCGASQSEAAEQPAKPAEAEEPKAATAEDEQSQGKQPAEQTNGFMRTLSRTWSQEKLLCVEDTAAVPTVWMTSSGLPSDQCKQLFVQTILKRRGVFDVTDDKTDDKLTLSELVAKYKATLATCKHVHVMDALYFRDHTTLFLDRQKDDHFFWDDELVRTCGFKKENVKTICMLTKPWLFNHPGTPGLFDPQKPNSGVTAEEEAGYFAKLKQMSEAYAALTSEPQQPVPVLPSEQSCADELAEVSSSLNRKYKFALDEWCLKTLKEADIVTGQGGDFMSLNLAFQINLSVARNLIANVRSGNIMYAAHSAGTMCMAKSIEITNQIGPGWLEAFSCSQLFLTLDGVMLDEHDLDGDGNAPNVLGALPMFGCMFTMRPQTTCSPVHMFTTVDGDTKDRPTPSLRALQDLDNALKLLNNVGQDLLKDQDRPVFLPLDDGIVVVGEILKGNEHFHLVRC